MFVAFYNSFVDDFLMLKKLLWFLCLAVVFSWAIIVGVLIPLNFLAAEVASNDNYEVIDKAGNPLAIRPSIVMAAEFSCSNDSIAQLQYLFISETQKELVLAVQILPRLVDADSDTSVTELANITTVNGNYVVPCIAESQKRGLTTSKDKKECALAAYRPLCGNNKLEAGEECEFNPLLAVIQYFFELDKTGDGCNKKTCVCNPGYKPGPSKTCTAICPKGYDFKLTPDKNCSAIVINNTLGGNSSNTSSSTNSTTNVTTYSIFPNGTLPSNRCCILKNPCDASPCATNAKCTWDGTSPSYSCACSTGFQEAIQWSLKGGLQQACIDVDECAEIRGGLGAYPLTFRVQCSKKCQNTPGSCFCG